MKINLCFLVGQHLLLIKFKFNKNKTFNTNSTGVEENRANFHKNYLVGDQRNKKKHSCNEIDPNIISNYFKVTYYFNN